MSIKRNFEVERGRSVIDTIGLKSGMCYIDGQRALTQEFRQTDGRFSPVYAITEDCLVEFADIFMRSVEMLQASPETEEEAIKELGL